MHKPVLRQAVHAAVPRYARQLTIFVALVGLSVPLVGLSVPLVGFISTLKLLKSDLSVPLVGLSSLQSGGRSDRCVHAGMHRPGALLFAVCTRLRHAAAVIDYTRQTEGSCKCVWPGDMHVPLPKNETSGGSTPPPPPSLPPPPSPPAPH